MICPLHGPILKDNLGYYIDKYQIWSSYQSEDEGVLVASASIHGNTKEVALKVVDLLKEKVLKLPSLILQEMTWLKQLKMLLDILK